MNPWHDEYGRFTSHDHVSHFKPIDPTWYETANNFGIGAPHDFDDDVDLDQLELSDSVKIDIQAYQAKRSLFVSNLSWYIEECPDARVMEYVDPETGEADFLIVSIDSVYSKTVANQGVSFDMSTASEPKDGYMVAAYTDRSDVIAGNATARYQKHKLGKFIEKNIDVLSLPNCHLGTWIDEKGNVSLDISERISDRDEAIAAGIERNEKAIFDVKNMVEIDTGGSGSYEDKLSFDVDD